MTDVLVVTAIKFGDPVILFVLVEANDPAFHVLFIIARLSRTICPA